MKIGLIAEPYEEGHASGMGYVVLELMQQFVKNSAHEYIFYSSKPISRDLIPGTYTNVLIPKGFVRQWFWFLRYRGDADVLVYMVPLLPLWLPRRVMSVPMCQELGSQKIKPGRLSGKIIAFVRDHLLMPITLRRSVGVVAASNATKEDVIHYYGIPDKKITVIYDGFQNLLPVAATAPAVDARLKPFFFFAGKVKPRKNVHRIVSAFIDYKERTQSSAHLVIAGDHGGAYYHQMVEEIRDHHLEESVHFVGYVTIEQLCSFYTHAIACVFPSINEGFGMPILEAMSLGTPVMTSNLSSMIEVGGDAALLVDPFSVEDISHGLEKLQNDMAFRTQCIERGRRHAAKFSWSKTAKEYVALLEKLV
ncbi:MAG: glycosyltransferase family 1 protein [Minisyncoccia bacterium]